MKRVILFRTFANDKQSLGLFSVNSDKGVELSARSLELPWKDNANSISCFAPGKYICKYTKSPSFSATAGRDVFTYEVTGVPGRAGIRIHSANYVSQLRGCIALGDAHKDINADNLADVTHSGDTITAFEKLMEKKDFVLEIIDATK